MFAWISDLNSTYFDSSEQPLFDLNIIQYFNSSAGSPTMENAHDVIVIEGNAELEEDVVPIVDAVGAQQPNETNSEEHFSYAIRERKKDFKIWEHVRVINLDDGTEMCECIHCGKKIKKFNKGTTTQMHRHVFECPKLPCFGKIFA